MAVLRVWLRVSRSGRKAGLEHVRAIVYNECVGLQSIRCCDYGRCVGFPSHFYLFVVDVDVDVLVLT